MELIHIANATFPSLRIKLSLENLASKQKTFRIVKEHTMLSGHRAITRAHSSFERMRSNHRTALRGRTRARMHCVRGWQVKLGGASRDRTGDLLVANQTLSQLSYGPSSI